MATEKRLVYLSDVRRAILREAPRLSYIADRLKPVDAVPVVHGRWITHNKGQNNWCECSECNTVGSPFWKRCPVCEAKMDGRSGDNA